MKITKIETIVLRIPYSTGGSSQADAWGGKAWSTADCLLVRVETDAGITGWGEAFGYNVISATRAILDDVIAPMVIGQPADAIEPLMLDLHRKLHIFGRGGPVIYALSGLDIALWDIAGKSAGLPLHRLLGGASRPEMPCYASLIRYGEPDLVRMHVRRAIDEGFADVKLHEIDLACIRAAREAAGPGPRLMLDVNCPWTLQEAIALSPALADVAPFWLEEPVWPPEDVSALARVRQACGLPIAAGENAATLAQFQQLLRAEAVDVIQPSPAKMGGVSELVKVFTLAAAHNVRVVPHSFYDGPAFLATVHVAAALQREPLVEWRYFDLEALLFGPAGRPAKGRMTVPTGAGLGLDPDPGVIARYRVA
ncbi:MAG: mandelate racemase/muconate lactonizing enzyme family protein [Burkholderiales bacterium]